MWKYFREIFCGAFTFLRIYGIIHVKTVCTPASVPLWHNTSGGWYVFEKAFWVKREYKEQILSYGEGACLAWACDPICD